MTFLWPRMLWLLVVVAALALGYVLSQRRRQRYALRFASLSSVKEAMGKGPGFRRHIPPILFLAAMTVIVVAVARPTAVVTLPSQRATIILTIDVSGSMRADDVAPSRLAAAQAAAAAFVQKQPKNQRIGVVTFAESAAVVQAPTTDHDAVLAAISRLRTFRGTAIGRGILVSLDAILEEYGDDPISLDRDPGFGSSRDLGSRSLGFGQDRDRGFGSFGQSEPEMQLPGDVETYPTAIMVLMSDGQSNTGPDPIEAVEQAALRGIRVFTVGLGNPDGTVLRIFSRSIRVRLDEETLKRIAEKTGATYFRAESDANLRTIYENLGTRLVFEPQRTEITAFFVAFAAMLLMAAGGFSLLWFSRLP
jgi:Ca-activated chloride channel family protein